MRTELADTRRFLHPANPSIIKLNGENIMAEFTLHIDGMHCGSCVRRVTQALRSTEGVQVEEVRVGGARLKSADAPHMEAAISALAKAGFTAHLEQ